MGKSWADRLMTAGAFLGFFCGYLAFAKGPPVNPAQRYFRIGLGLVGIGLFIIGLVLKALENRDR